MSRSVGDGQLMGDAAVSLAETETLVEPVCTRWVVGVHAQRGVVEPFVEKCPHRCGEQRRGHPTSAPRALDT